MFDRKGQIIIDAGGRDEDSTLEAALEAGAEDFAREDDRFLVTTDATLLHAVKQALDQLGLEASEASIGWIPRTTVSVEGENAEKLLKLLEELEGLDDVQKVDANFDMDMSQFAAS
jgi:transcriptional/translational regulatory protein YebC/TACO1